MKASVILSLLVSFTSAAVFTATTWNDISIAGGTAGNAEEEALAALAGLPEDLATVEQADIDFLKAVNKACNEAEKGAYNTAIEAATGEEAEALQRGKIKNKVLKLEATILSLNAQAAQGEDVTEKLAAEQKKLDNNISQDQAEAGKTSTPLEFDSAIPK